MLRFYFETKTFKKMFAPLRRICNKNSTKLLVSCCKHALQTNPYSAVTHSKKVLPILSNQQFCRFESKGSKPKKEESESESEVQESGDDFLENIQDKNTKTTRITTNSLRVDAILKSGLGIARNKIEQLFYESKIRVNGEKILKKSASVQEGDEIDVIKGVNTKNPNFLIVARVEVLSITPKGESISIKIRRCKSLTVENYVDK